MDLKMFLEKEKEALDQILKETEIGYEKFRQIALEDLDRRKLTLGTEVEKLSKTQQEKYEIVNKLSKKIIELNDGIKVADEKLKKYEVKQKEMLAKVIEIEQRENAVVFQEKVQSDKASALSAKEDALTVEQRLLSERQARINRYLK